MIALLFSVAFALPTQLTNGSLIEQRSTSYTSCTMEGKVVAMTFDDGPYIYNEDLVNYLNSEGVKATFFVNGYNWDCIYDEPYPTYLKHLIASGHHIASHTWSHPDLEDLTQAEVVQQLELIDQALYYILDLKPRYFRPPYGDVNHAIDLAVQAQGQVVVTWNFDSGDSTGSTVAESEQAYREWIATGKSLIALNHETYSSTVNNLVRTVIPELKAAGYQFVTIDQCLGLGSPYITPTGPKPKGPMSC